MLGPMLRPWVRMFLCALAGLLLGWLMSSLPAPSDVGTFWVGNFSAPWAVLAFGAGWAQRSRLRAAVAGVAAEAACVVGFYGQFLVGGVVDPKRLGFVGSTDALTLIATAIPQWLGFIAPWVVAAIGAGVVYGFLGRWWGESRSIVAGVGIALPFIVEPAAWRIYVGFSQGPLVVWFVEVALGIGILGWVIAARSRGRDLVPDRERPN
jgi:Family of unknown function (DUF6518)